MSRRGHYHGGTIIGRHDTELFAGLNVCAAGRKRTETTFVRLPSRPNTMALPESMGQ